MPIKDSQKLSWVMQMNNNLNATVSGGNANDAGPTISPTISPTIFRVPISLREVSEKSYIAKFLPIGLYSHATAITNSSIHIKFREEFARIFMGNRKGNSEQNRDWDDTCRNVVGNSVQDLVELYGDFKLEQQGEDGLADAPRGRRTENIDHHGEDGPSQQEGRGHQDADNITGNGHPNLNSLKEILVLLALDAVFVVCFIQGDHQRACRDKFCPAVTDLDQEMKKVALSPLVYFIRLDLFKFENQIPLDLIKRAVEMISFEGFESWTGAWTTDPFKKFLVDAVDLIYLLPGPRKREQFKSVLRGMDFSNCRHLLHCLYLVVCYNKSESSQQGNEARAETAQSSLPRTRTSETIIAKIWNRLQRCFKVGNRGNTEGAERVGSSGARVALSTPGGQETAQGPGDTVHPSQNVDVEMGNSGNNQDHNIRGPTDHGEIQPVPTIQETETDAPADRDNGGGAVGQPGQQPTVHDQASTSPSHEEIAQLPLARTRTFETGSSGAGVALSTPGGQETAQGPGDTVHPSQNVDVEMGNSGNNQDHNIRGPTDHGEIQPVPTIQDTGTNAPAGRDKGGRALGQPGQQFPACGWPCFCKRGPTHHRLHIPTITELQKAGIKVVVGHRKGSTNWISEVNFKGHTYRFCNGTLYLPGFSVFDETEILFRNLLMYEYVVEKKKDLLSYIHLMQNLIKTEEDVKLMMESGVLKNNSLGSDKLLADMWNRILIGTVIQLNKPYQDLFGKIMKHYESRCNKLYAEFHGRYLGRPWLFCGSIFLLLTAGITITAVVFTILGYYHGSKRR